MTPLTIDADTRLLSAGDLTFDAPITDPILISRHTVIIFDPASGRPIAVCRPLASDEDEGEDETAASQSAAIARTFASAWEANVANGPPPLSPTPETVRPGTKFTDQERRQLRALWLEFPTASPGRIARSYALKYGRNIAIDTARKYRPTARKVP